MKPRKLSKRKNPGVGIDFKKAKHKVGKKLPRAQNDTETEIKSGKLFLRESSIATDKSELATTSRNNTLRELLSQVKHYSEKIRIKAINGLIELIREHPSEARPHAAEIIAATSALASDPDKACRAAFVTFLRSALFPAIGERAIQPFVAFLMAHVCSAMTHLSADVRDSGIETINVLLEFRPDLVGKGYFSEIAEHYVEALNRSNRGRSLTAGSLKNLATICEGCRTFLRATLPRVGIHSGTGESNGFVGFVGQNDIGASEVGQVARAPVILNQQRCAWGRIDAQSRAGTPADADAGSSSERATGSGESRDGVVLGTRLFTLLLDCWEECGLVSKDDHDMDVSRGMHGSGKKIKGAKGSLGFNGAAGASARQATKSTRSGKSIKSVSESCGAAILHCCTLLLTKFKANILSEDSSAKIFRRIFPSYPSQIGCDVSEAAADLVTTTIAELHEAHRPFDEEAVDVLAAWSVDCLASDFSAGTKVSLAIMSFASHELQASMLRHIFDAWRRWDREDELDDKKLPASISEAVMLTKNLGLKFLLRLVEPPIQMRRLASLDEVLALWVGEIPSLLWKVQTLDSPGGAQHTYKLGLSVLLHASRFAGSEASCELLPNLCSELDRMSLKLVPLFSLKIKGKVRPGPLTRMPESLQTMAVEVLHNLPGLDNAVLGAVHSSLPPSSAPLAQNTIRRLLDLVYFKAELGEPQKVWSLICSALERGTGDQDEDRIFVLDHVSRIALHCSPANAAIQALVPALLSKKSEPAACGALFLLRHCLMVFDDSDLDIEKEIVEAIVMVACDRAHASTSLARDVIVRLLHQVPCAIPIVFSRLAGDKNKADGADGASDVLAGRIIEALSGELDLPATAVAELRSLVRARDQLE